MFFYKRIPLFLLAVVIMICCSSWGFLVHQTLHQLAVYQLPKAMQPFFYKYMDDIVSNAIRPDTRHSKDSTETAKHVINIEAYGKDAVHTMPLNWTDAIQKYSKDSLYKHGYVPYHIIFMKDKLTEAFRSGDVDSILFYASDMGHYIADANVPLHTTINYNGQLSNQKGIHSLWESLIPEIEISHYQLYSSHKATYLSHPEKAIWEAVRKANALVSEILAKEKAVSMQFTADEKYNTQIFNSKKRIKYSPEFTKAYANALGNMVNNQLINSSNLIADFWYTAWVDAGKPNLNIMFDRLEKKSFKAEKISYRKNKLVQNNLLRALQMKRKGESKQEE